MYAMLLQYCVCAVVASQVQLQERCARSTPTQHTTTPASKQGQGMNANLQLYNVSCSYTQEQCGGVQWYTCYMQDQKGNDINVIFMLCCRHARDACTLLATTNSSL
eukprot:scpid109960/ scgid23282/ 